MHTPWNDCNMLRVSRVGLYLLLPLLLIGCATPAAYREPITRFQQASTVVIEGARLEYSLANKRERDAAIDKLVDKRVRIDLKALSAADLIVLTAEDLSIRMSALDTLAKHAQLLLALASSDAPTKAADAANSLDDAILGLSGALGNAPSTELNAKAAGFATIAAEVTKLALEAKIVQALDKSIALSEKDVAALIRLIANDISSLNERQRSIFSGRRVRAVDDYNAEVAKNPPNVETLRAAASEVKKVEDEWASLHLSLRGSPSLDAMAQAHDKLVIYAKSPKSPQDLAALIEATDAFVTRATVIANAIKVIRNTKE